MDMRMNEDVNVRYLAANEQDFRWGLTVNTVGHQLIKPHAPYPSVNHPFVYLFSTAKGRVLNEYQLIYILHGGGTFASAHKKEITIHAGQMILLFPGEWHSYAPNPQTGWYEHWIGFDGSAIEGLVRQGFFDQENPVFEIGMNEEVIRLYKRAAHIATLQTAGFQQMLAGIVHLLLGYTFAENRQICFENRNVATQINQARALLTANFNKAITPQEVAAQVNMSYSWFRKVFKQYTGFSPSQFRENLRIQRSKELLVGTSLSSQQIAFEVGFDTPYYFSLLFKKRTGYSPLRYRAWAQGKDVLLCEECDKVPKVPSNFHLRK